jgi:hypothetical protein
MPREHAEQREQRVPPEAAVAADEQHGDGLVRVRLAERAGLHHLAVERRALRLLGAGQLLVEALHGAHHDAVVPLHSEADEREPARDQHREPAALAELLVHSDAEDRETQRRRDHVRGQVARPRRLLLAALPPEHRHGDVRERERQEHVDRIEDDELRDVAPRVGQRSDGRGAHEEHAVAHREPLGERREAVREPRVRGHVGHDARPVEKARLRRDEEQRALARERRRSRKRRPRERRPASTPRRRARSSTAFIVLSLGHRRRSIRAGTRAGCRPR